MREMESCVDLVHAIDAQTVTSGGGAVNSGDIDRQGAEGMLFVYNIGDNGGDTLSGSNHFELKVEHADDDGTGSAGAYEAVADDDVVLDTGLAAVQAPDASGIIIDIDDAAEDQASYKFAYKGDRRFVKVTITPQGTLTNGNPMSLDCVKHDLSHRTAQR
jgi:hypothetical protein